MSLFKGSNYVGSFGPKFGGFYGDSPQPKSGWGKFDGEGSNKGRHGDPESRRGELLGKGKFKPTCKSCGGKM